MVGLLDFGQRGVGVTLGRAITASSPPPPAAVGKRSGVALGVSLEQTSFPRNGQYTWGLSATFTCCVVAQPARTAMTHRPAMATRDARCSLTPLIRIRTPFVS